MGWKVGQMHMEDLIIWDVCSMAKSIDDWGVVAQQCSFGQLKPDMVSDLKQL
jgi:hypothetical protein